MEARGSSPETCTSCGSNHCSKSGPGNEDIRLHNMVLSLPHPEKIEKEGEDAFLVKPLALAVFDGVGSWGKQGVDAGRYSKRLSLLTGRNFETYRGSQILNSLERALKDTTLPGSTTACVASINGSRLQGVNVGDSGLMVFRDGEMVYRSIGRCHEFNRPFQLSYRNYNDLYKSPTIDFELCRGDVIISATDGLLDNVFEKDITITVKKHMDAWSRKQDIFLQFEGYLYRKRFVEGTESKASTFSGNKLLGILVDIGNRVCKAAHHPSDDTPFSKYARQQNFDHEGGKIDDITIVASLVVTSCDRYSCSFLAACPNCDSDKNDRSTTKL